ncbi:MAG: glucose-6-phosphate dehydrogenase [Nitrospira sp. SG-bin1]|nr:MAG: glucose-6-phosphate dehydrogenase [Nitrospira sp. SG-bin1]
MTQSFVIFGATGDLTGRFLLPAFAHLLHADRLSDAPTIVGIGREPWDRMKFRRHVEEQLILHSDTDEQARGRLIARLEYQQADITDQRQVETVLGKVKGPIVAYLALPAGLFAPVIRAVATSAKEGTRIIVEKPFGEDLESARALNRLLHDSFSESAIFRMDHFLGMRTVQNLLGLRFANRLFEPLWSCEHVSRVEIIWDETLGLEGRSSYYDRAGALRDMVQNHLLQVLCYVAMEPPLTLDAHDLRSRKVDVLRAVNNMTAEEVHTRTVRARYGAGRIGDRAIQAYVDEAGIKPERRTETFVKVVLYIDNWRWAGVPFMLRTGKALARDRQEMVVHFKPVPHLAFEPGTSVQHNRLRMQFDPDRIDLHLNVTGADELFSLKETALEKQFVRQTIPAYGQVLLDVIHGDQTLSIRHDEAEESWRIVQPILDAWAEGRSPLQEYPAGSEGPT